MAELYSTCLCKNKLSRPAVSSSSRSMDTGSGLEMVDKWTQACQDRVAYLLYCSAQVQVYTARNVKTPCAYSLINRFDRCIFESILVVLLCMVVKRPRPNQVSRFWCWRELKCPGPLRPGMVGRTYVRHLVASPLLIAQVSWLVSCLPHFWTIAKFTRFCIHTTGSWFFSHSILVPTKVVLKLLLLVRCETSKLIGAACTCSLF